MRAIVTGGAGFIGSHVAEILLAEGHRVLVLDDLSGGYLGNIPSGADFEKHSVNEPLDDPFSKYHPDFVFHLAAYAAEGLSHHIPVFTFTNNVSGTANVLGAAYRAKARHFVFTSSIAAYGHPKSTEPFSERTACHPVDPYGVAKLACEYHIRACEQYYGGPAFTIFRPHNVFGPRQNISDPYRNVVGIFMAKGMRGEPMPIFGDGAQTRSFSYISTVAHCIAAAPRMPASKNMTINIGGDEQMTVLKLAQEVSQVLGVPEMIDWLPPRKEVVHAHCRHDLARRYFADIYKQSVNIKEGLLRMAKFVRETPIPPPTNCPSPIEIMDLLPPSWRERVSAPVHSAM